MQRDELIEAWADAERQPTRGWDFGYLDGRMVEEEPPWSYTARAAKLMGGARALLDLGTGGGERLLGLRGHWPARVVATESYPPNRELATERLGQHGATVVDVTLADAAPMPFADGAFDLVLNRHSGLNPREVGRVLAPGGAFLTQQIHGLWAADLIAAFDAAPPWPDATPAKYVPLLESAGLEIVDLREWAGSIAFMDVGAIVYYLRKIPWLVAGFSVASHARHLLRLQERLERGERLAFEARKYLIEARKAMARDV